MPEAKTQMLEKFISAKKQELKQKKLLVPYTELEKHIPIISVPSFKKALEREGVNIIAEIKYASPSKGSFNNQLSPPEIAKSYEENGAAAISILTDTCYFSGDLNYIDQVRSAGVDRALLRKDFIIDRYQILEARIHGASAYLLIASCLSKSELIELIAFGRELDLQALVEVHNEREIDSALKAGAEIIGVNNRNLDDLSINVDTSFQLIEKAGDNENIVFVSESGIDNHSTLMELKEAGFNAFLVGSYFMQSQSPGDKLKELLSGDHDN